MAYGVQRTSSGRERACIVGRVESYSCWKLTFLPLSKTHLPAAVILDAPDDSCLLSAFKRPLHAIGRTHGPLTDIHALRSSQSTLTRRASHCRRATKNRFTWGMPFNAKTAGAARWDKKAEVKTRGLANFSRNQSSSNRRQSDPLPQPRRHPRAPLGRRSDPGPGPVAAVKAETASGSRAAGQPGSRSPLHLR